MDRLLTLFWILMGMVIIWFGMVTALFQRLKSKHSEKYRAMGEPHLIQNNTMRTGLAPFKFLFKREHRSLNDRPLSLLGDFMLVFFIIYVALFICLFRVFRSAY